MRTCDSAYDTMMAGSHPHYTTLADPACYMVCGDGRVLVWPDYESSIDDDGAKALDVDWGDMDDDAAAEWLSGSGLWDAELGSPE